MTPLQLLVGTDFGNLAVILAPIPALQQPWVDAQELLPIAAGPLDNAEAALGVLVTVPLALGLTALSPVVNGGTALGNTVSELIDAAQTADPEKAFNSIVDGSGDVTKALLDRIVDEFGGGFPPSDTEPA